MWVVGRALKNSVLQSRQDLRENCQIISQMFLPSAFFITGQKVPEAREINLSAIIRLMKAEVFFVLITVMPQAQSLTRHRTICIHLTAILKNLLPATPSKFQTKQAIIYNTCITLVCFAVTCLCILGNFPMKLKHKSCNAMSDISITVTNNMKLIRKTIYRSTDSH